MLDVPENLCVPLLTVTPPNAAAADILLTPSPPKKIDRRAAAEILTSAQGSKPSSNSGYYSKTNVYSVAKFVLHSVIGIYGVSIALNTRLVNGTPTPPSNLASQQILSQNNHVFL